MNYFLHICFLFVLATISHAQIDSTTNYKINGVSFVSSDKPVLDENISPILELNATWVSVIPFGFMPSKNEPLLSFNNDWQWFGERLDGAKQIIKEMHNHDLEVMLKPQLWVGMGDYTGFVQMESEDEWLKLESAYENFILSYAELAEQEEVKVFCIGTEMSQFAQLRPSFWRGLIAKVRQVYFGKLTYAENWDCFDKIQFWDDLDFIGVDAYFPLTKTKRSRVNSIIKAWTKHVHDLDSISLQFDKQVLFTEYGYRSVDHCTKEPWDYNKKGKPNEKTQRDALKALFHVFWNKENFAGGFLWKWWPDHQSVGGKNDTTFTVQNKLSESLVKSVYAN